MCASSAAISCTGYRAPSWSSSGFRFVLRLIAFFLSVIPAVAPRGRFLLFLALGISPTGRSKAPLSTTNNGYGASGSKHTSPLITKLDSIPLRMPASINECSVFWSIPHAENSYSTVHTKNKCPRGVACTCNSGNEFFCQTNEAEAEKVGAQRPRDGPEQPFPSTRIQTRVDPLRRP